MGKKAYLLSLGGNVARQEDLSSRLGPAAVEGQVSLAFDLPKTDYSVWFLNHVLGLDLKTLGEEIREFVSGLEIPQSMADSFVAHLESLHTMKRRGFVGSVHPIGIDRQEVAGASELGMAYTRRVKEIDDLQTDFIGQIILFNDFEKLKELSRSILEKLTHTFFFKESFMRSNIFNMFLNDEARSGVVVVWPLYVNPLMKDLEIAGIEAKPLAPRIKFGNHPDARLIDGRHWQTEILKEAMQAVQSGASPNPWMPTQQASLAISRYTLLRALAYIETVKAYFYLGRIKAPDTILEDDKAAIKSLSSEREARFHYAARQNAQWSQFRESLPAMRGLLRTDELNRMERIVNRAQPKLKLAA